MNNPFEVLRVWGLEKLGRYYSQYRAIVVDSKPDDKNIGDITVHIPRVQGGMKIIARSKASVGGPGYGKRFFLPHPGEVVWVEFQNGDPCQPLWSYHTWGIDECPEELKDLNTCGIVTPNGNKILINEGDKGDSLTITINEGSTIKIEKDVVTFNDGSNHGLVNIDKLKNFIDKVSLDLVAAKSGTNVSQWMSTELANLEDPKIVH